MPAACWAAERAKAGARGAECGPQRCKAQIRCATARMAPRSPSRIRAFGAPTASLVMNRILADPVSAKTLADIYRFTIRFARQEF
jgi:hypothetical protein